MNYKTIFLALLTVSFTAGADVSATIVTSESEAGSAAETSTNTSTEASAEASDTTTDSESAEGYVAPQENYVECADGYLEYIRSLPKNAQQAEFEVWWEYTDNEYRLTKNDEFKYKEEKTKWLEKFNAEVAKKDSTYFIAPKVKLGQYDFKKKGFPVEFLTHKQDKYIMSQSTGAFSMGGLGGGTTDKAYCSSTFMDNKNKDLPSAVYFRIQNLDKMKFLPVEEKNAKLITANLGGSRVVELKMKISPKKTQKITKKMGVMKFTDIFMDVNVTEAYLYADSEQLKFQF